MQLTIQVNELQLQAAQRMLQAIPGGIDVVLYRACNDVSITARKEIVRLIRTQLTAVKSSDLKARNVRLTSATRSNPTARIDVSGARIPLSRLAARQTKAGVSYTGVRGQGRTTIKSAFIRTMESGHVGVFRRLGKSRLPITELKGPSVPQVLEHVPDFEQGLIEEHLAEQLYKRIDYQTTRLLEK